ncbi:MAG: class B sortase [Porcipelethomonas sp.]
MNNKLKISIICSAVVAVAAVGAVLLHGGNNKPEVSQTADVLEPLTEAPTEPELPEIENFSPEPGMTGLAKTMRQINDDIVGWIRISNTQVDYPVAQYEYDTEDGNYFYLHNDIYGNYLESGTIFMDYRDVFGADEDKQTDNVVLYGHNMLNGSKFGDLHNYRNDDSFYEENPIIEFSSNYKDYKYVIFAYLLTSGDYGDSYYGEDFPYWDIHDLSNEKDFNDYVKTIDERSYIHPDIDVSYGDKLLTLSTCHLDVDNSRFLVVGRRLRDDETEDNIAGKTANSANNSSDNSEDKDEADE